jgi:hypothetical protein
LAGNGKRLARTAGSVALAAAISQPQGWNIVEDAVAE